jgi:capsule polysaccharide export protein KpsE/RkpR
MARAEVDMANHAIHDKLETQIKIAEAKLDIVKAQAESARPDAEIRVVPELLAWKRALQLELRALKKLGGDRWEQAKADLEAHIACFQKLLKDAESKTKAG